MIRGMQGLVRIPAFVDIHVHFREPGFPEKEDIESGAAAAAAGGYRAVCMMPNTRPAIDSPSGLLAVDLKGRECAGAYGVRIFAASAMTLSREGKALVDLDAMDFSDTACRGLTGHGVCGVTEDGDTLRDGALMEQVCTAAVRLGLPVMDHAEPEVEIIRRDIGLAKRTGARFHIQHVSLAESVTLIRAAKAEGVPMTCETAPHYFALTEAETAAERHGANAKMNPPLRTERDRLAILHGLVDGTIDCIATDHAPHEAAAKALPHGEAANGVIGLETAFPVSYTLLVRSGLIPLEGLVRLMAVRPAEIIGLPPEPDSWVEVDLDAKWEIDAGAFRSKGRNTPFDGMRVYGRVVRTIVNNRPVYGTLSGQ
ncbi:MAG: dihydroorotase [Clostridiales bacterium]|nr:dihydroorotase [Clostridiales bacterium]